MMCYKCCTVQYSIMERTCLSNFKALEGTANRAGLKVLSKLVSGTLTCEWKLWS